MSRSNPTTSPDVEMAEPSPEPRRPSKLASLDDFARDMDANDTEFRVHGRHHNPLHAANQNEGLRTTTSRFRYSKQPYNVYDFVSVDDSKDIDISSIDAPYVNRSYLTVFVKYKLFHTNVQYTLLKLRSRKHDESLSKTQYREIVDDAYQKISKIGALISSIVDVFESVVSQLFVVKFAAMFNYYYKQYATVRAEEALQTEQGSAPQTLTSFLDFLTEEYLSVYPGGDKERAKDDCMAANASVEEFYGRLKDEFLALYEFDRHRQPREHSNASPSAQDNVLRFFDPGQKYAAALVHHFRRLTDSDSYFVVTDVPRLVELLLNMMNLQMHLLLKSEIVSLAAEDVPQSYVNYWTFTVLSSWVMCDYQTSARLFADGCSGNYRDFIRSVEDMKTDDASASVIETVQDGLRRLHPNRRSVLMGEPDQAGDNYGRFVAKLVTVCAECLGELIDEDHESSTPNWSKLVYRYCFRYINGVDTQYGIEHFAMKEKLEGWTFHRCKFNDFESSTKKQPCNYWVDRDQLLRILESNSGQNVQSVLQLIKDVNELDASRRRANKQHHDWLNLVSQKRSPSSFDDEFPYMYAINDADEYNTDNQALLVDLFEMHVDIVMSVWVMYINSLLRIVGTSVSHEDAVLATIIAASAQTANFGIEGSYDVLQFVLGHVVR